MPLQQVTMSALSARLLDWNISRLRDGFKPRESDKWREVHRKIQTALGEYGRDVKVLLDDAEYIALADMKTDERNDEIREINRQIRELDDEATNEVTLTFEPLEFALITQHWYEIPQPGDDRSLDITAAINVALEHPTGVQIVDNQVVPIEQSEPAPTALRPRPGARQSRPKQLKAAR